MTITGIFLIALAVSIDAMAVAAASGAKNHHLSFIQSFRIAIVFGLFQGFMPLIGWVIGVGLQTLISGFDHWIAFLLLAILGVKMILECFKKIEDRKIDIKKIKILILLAIATSIDALVVGMTFAMLPVNIWTAVVIIGSTTFILSLLSVYIGKKCGEKWGKKAEIVGGVILIMIGLKILLNHLMI